MLPINIIFQYLSNNIYLIIIGIYIHIYVCIYVYIYKQIDQENLYIFKILLIPFYLLMYEKANLTLKLHKRTCIYVYFYNYIQRFVVRLFSLCASGVFITNNYSIYYATFTATTIVLAISRTLLDVDFSSCIFDP